MPARVPAFIWPERRVALAVTLAVRARVSPRPDDLLPACEGRAAALIMGNHLEAERSARRDYETMWLLHAWRDAMSIERLNALRGGA